MVFVETRVRPRHDPYRRRTISTIRLLGSESTVARHFKADGRLQVLMTVSYGSQLSASIYRCLGRVHGPAGNLETHLSDPNPGPGQ